MKEATSCGGVVIFRGKILVLYKNTGYTFNVSDDVVNKTVHWYLCEADSYDTRPQREEFFEDAGFYKFHEAYHLLKFPNEKQILERAYGKYIQMRKEKIW